MYPIVLVHGFLGYKKLFCWRMFKDVEKLVEERGFKVFFPPIHPTRSISERALELKNKIDKALGVNEKFHIIAHSMGGLDARFLASINGLNQGDRVISISTIGTPHRGSKAALNLPKVYLKGVASVARILILVNRKIKIGSLSQEEVNFLKLLAEGDFEALTNLTPTYLEEFNSYIVNHPDTKYFSYAGDVSQINKSTRKLALLIFNRILKVVEKGANDKRYDSLVTVESSVWGDFKGVVEASHSELIGLKLLPFGKPSFNHLLFFNDIIDNIVDSL
jgi:triacylglycerol lipase